MVCLKTKLLVVLLASQSWAEDFLALVDSHWLQHEPPAPAFHYLLATLFSLVMLVGVYRNAINVHMFIGNRSLRTPVNILVLNLAVSDILSLLSLNIFIYNSVFKGPALGVRGCQVYGFVGVLAGTVSMVTQTMIALYRYRAVVHPLRHDPSHGGARCLSLASWLYGAFLSTPPLLLSAGAGRYVPDGYLTTCSVDYLHPGNRYFVLLLDVAGLLLPLLLLVSLYGAVCKSAICDCGDNDARAQRRSRDSNRTELSLALMVSVVVALCVLLWTPSLLVTLFAVSGQYALLSPQMALLAALCCKTASCLNPFVYCIKQRSFWQELCRLRDSAVLASMCVFRADDREEAMVLYVMVNMQRRNALVNNSL